MHQQLNLGSPVPPTGGIPPGSWKEPDHHKEHEGETEKKHDENEEKRDGE